MFYSSFKKYKNHLLGTTVLLIVAYMVILTEYEDYHIKKRGYYTLGYTDGYIYLMNSRKIRYHIIVNNEQFNGSISYPEHIKKEGGVYVVRFLPDKPIANRIDFSVEYPDSLPRPPAEGWKEYPLRKYGYKFKH